MVCASFLLLPQYIESGIIIAKYIFGVFRRPKHVPNVTI